MPVTGTESWTVLGDDGAVVAPVERYLAYLSALERSPNTVRAYATSLKLWFEFLAQAGVGWADAGVEDVARFVAWLRAPADNVIVLETGTGRRAPATVNRHLAGVFGFYDHHARAGVGVAGELVAWRRVSRGSYKPFLHHVTKGRPVPTRPVKLIVTRRVPRTLMPGRWPRSWPPASICGTGSCWRCWPRPAMRVGQALGLRHCRLRQPRREIRIVARPDNANGARAKLRDGRGDPGVDAAGALVLGVHARRVRRPRLATTCSSTCSAGGSGSRCATRRCTSSSPGSPRAPGSSSRCTCCVTRTPPS